MISPAMITGETSWTRMSEGIEKVKARFRRATALLETAGLAYAVIGGNAVAAWVSRVDDSVVRNTRDVGLLVRREDMEALVEVMARGGFIRKGRFFCTAATTFKSLGPEMLAGVRND
jgi:hypothetical protein